MDRKNVKGITLIALIITIIVLLILAGVVINMTVGNQGLLYMSNGAAFKYKMQSFKEQTDMYVAWQISETLNTNTDGINSGDKLKEFVENELITDISAEDISVNIKDIIKDISNNEKDYIAVYKGQMYYVSNPSVKDNDLQVKWCKEIGIPILEFDYTEPTGIVVKNGKYEFVNNLWLCTPNLSSGFDLNYTRYMELNSNGKLVPGNWATNNPSDTWYDYNNQKWANIYVEKDGNDFYYVWMPRYCFKLDQENKVSEVLFIDTDNSYKDPTQGEDASKVEWASLEAQGYQVPEAFTVETGSEIQELAGFWVMKYEAGNTVTPSIIRYDMSTSKGTITLKNLQLNTTVTNSNPITSYTISLNGTVVDTQNSITQVVLTNTKQGDNVVNITGLNENGEIVGSMTKTYSPAVVNKPELSAFNQDTTFYVTYDDDGKEHSTTPISKDFPQYWYDYGETRWANIVTRVDGYECYYVWIPRYQFSLDQTNQKADVRFIKGDSTETIGGYQIPEAFTVKTESGTKELTGYWVMKYEAGPEFGPKFDAGVTATSNSIRVKGITGSGVAANQVYKYYLNGDYKGQSTTATDEYEYTGLTAGTKYTILIEIRNSSDAYVGTIVKQITTVAPNSPELSGFSESNTYYVTYDETGTNATVGSKIKKDGSNAPSNWYDYSKNRWANIVQTNGTVEDGQIKNATVTIYYVWIPRYEFRLPTSQYAQSNIGKSEVRFVGTNITNDNCTTGYQVPEAFSQNGQELPGYWVMKYEAGN